MPDAGIDDATQDVFLVVHRRLQDFDGRTPLRSWLIGIARKVAARHRDRARRRSQRLELLDDGTQLHDEGSVGPHSGAIRVEAAAFVESFLAGLPPKLRGVFQLCEVEGMSAPEVSDALGIPVNTVYSRLRLARERFEAGLVRRRHRERRETS